MSDSICLDENYSTTRLLTKEMPEIINNPEDKFETVLFLPMGENRKGEGGLRTKGFFKKSYDDKPLISIITVVYNGEKHLQETIQSVINQTYDNVEYIIIDGGSSDGTIDIIKKYEDQIDYWVSEKDNGIYDAMNKGIKVAKGKWLNFMNAGDKFYDKETLNSIFAENDLAVYTLIYGNTFSKEKIEKAESIKFLEYGIIMACHQSMFFNTELLGNELHYKTIYKIYADYELVNRIYLNYSSSLKYIDTTISNYEGGGISSFVSKQKRKDKYVILYTQYGIFGILKSIYHRFFRNENNGVK